jgi:hypothetical protein
MTGRFAKPHVPSALAFLTSKNFSKPTEKFSPTQAGNYIGATGKRVDKVSGLQYDAGSIT